MKVLCTAWPKLFLMLTRRYRFPWPSLACSRLRDSGGKSFRKKKCEKRAGAGIFPAATAPFPKSCASYFRFARFNTFPLYYLRAWHRLGLPWLWEYGSLSPTAKSSLCREEAGEREEGKSAGDDGKGKERKKGSRLFPLPIAHRPLTIFHLLLFFLIGKLSW